MLTNRKEIVNMSITKDGIEEYIGCVISTSEHMWADGMLEETAWVWDMEAHEYKGVQIGYYGADGYNFCGRVKVTIDLSEEAKRDILRTIKRTEALKAFERSVIAHKTEIRKGTHAEVIRGRKVAKGTRLEVFWVGDRLTYRGMKCGFEDYETIAGCYDENGNKIWIRVDYLKNIDPIKSPSATERKKFIKAYVANTARSMGVR